MKKILFGIMILCLVFLAGCATSDIDGVICVDEESFDSLCDEVEETEEEVEDETVDEVEEETDEAGIEYVASKPAAFKTKDDVRESCDLTCGKGNNCWVKVDGTIVCF
ncbi:MAG: hypothetical protein ISS01_02710 [Nanoarchaeota archaeon]|nr:hypothetical protein [Nanoarchaeota archaeon]